MKIGIILDEWKLPIFEEKLNDVGCKFTQEKGPHKGTIALKIDDADPFKLRTLIGEANKQCAKWKREKKN